MSKCSGCGKTGAQLQCPKCRELGLQPTLFCEQTCFKKSWKTHKAVHDSPPACTLDSMSPEELMMFNFTGPLRPGKLTPKRFVPKHIERPDYADHPQGISPSEDADNRRGRGDPIRLGPESEAIMRTVCKLGREVLDLAGRAVRPGVTTDEIDRIVHEAALERNCYPSPLNYNGFPKSVCTSVNEVICHGIPDSRVLEEGDIVNIDVTVYHKGHHGDLNETFYVGRVDERGRNLVNGAYECLQAAIAEVKPGTFYRSIGNIIEQVAKERGLGVVRTYCGHGIHSLFHTSPTIPHYAKNKAVGVMKPGHIFTIEPMINEGTWADTIWPDNWTAVTQDGKRSAQFEETMLVTETGVEVLTARPDGAPPLFKQLEQEWA
eukprot:NODE_2154_length_1265_cov_91.497364_g2048_i0.p1 GENE.NODE_2154_length_1265_cov_91.497364_g2048_i0~~NODE_2154_length_1265_cov_91.497364_g2048_i0.p1  ORF type:complete len:376 (+),score=63.49 NODE_2154_length_1265_cov_91.497364_g2048_i0:46-1173(+)